VVLFAAGEEPVDEAIEGVFEGGAPRSSKPDRLGEMGAGVGEKRRGAREAEDGEVGRARSERAAAEIRGGGADGEAIDEPLHELLSHRWRTARKDGHQADRPLLEFLDHLRRLSVLVAGGAGEHVVARRQPFLPHGVEDFLLVRNLPEVAVMVAEEHVDDGARNENEDGGERDRKPEGRYGNHLVPPRKSATILRVLA
jgi:hypothetical protein